MQRYAKSHKPQRNISILFVEKWKNYHFANSSTTNYVILFTPCHFIQYFSCKVLLN